MASVFTRIIEGTLPGEFVHRDDTCVAFMSVEPLQPGHVLVVPIAEVDHWLDLDEDIMTHLVDVSRTIGTALDATFEPEKVALMIAGLEVPHVHIHVVPINAGTDLDFRNATPTDPADLAVVAQRIRQALNS